MTKAELLEELADVPDDATIMIDIGPDFVLPSDFWVSRNRDGHDMVMLVPGEGR